MPTRQKKHYVIAYDITDNSKRTRLANLLLDFGTRVQKSMFEAELTSEELQEILRHAANCMESADSVRVYPQCKSCAEDIQALGCSVNTAATSLRIV